MEWEYLSSDTEDLQSEARKNNIVIEVKRGSSTVVYAYVSPDNQQYLDTNYQLPTTSNRAIRRACRARRADASCTPQRSIGLEVPTRTAPRS